ncbi:MAG: hypothetical protein RTU30_16165 [Candidatus Thorarchaeota archaeon]
MSRLGRLVLLIGITLLIISVSPPHRDGEELVIQADEYLVQFVYAAGVIQLTTEVQGQREDTYTFVVLTDDDALLFLEEQSMEGIDSLLLRENISEWRGDIEIYQPGWYAVVFSTSSNISIPVTLLVQRPGPHRILLQSGLVFVAGGLLFISIARYQSSSGSRKSDIADKNESRGA